MGEANVFVDGAVRGRGEEQRGTVPASLGSAPAEVKKEAHGLVGLGSRVAWGRKEGKEFFFCSCVGREDVEGKGGGKKAIDRRDGALGSQGRVGQRNEGSAEFKSLSYVNKEIRFLPYSTGPPDYSDIAVSICSERLIQF